MSLKDELKSKQESWTNPIKYSRQSPIDSIYYQKYASIVCSCLREAMENEMKSKPRSYKKGFFSMEYKYTARYLLDFGLVKYSDEKRFHYINHEGLYITTGSYDYEDGYDPSIVLYTCYLEDIKDALYYLIELLNSQGFDEIFFQKGGNKCRFSTDYVDKIISNELDVEPVGRKSFSLYIEASFNCDSSGKLL